jgi:hypothetical protein
MTFKELLQIVPDPQALEERAAIIQFDSLPDTPGREPPMTQAEAEAECVRQWLAANPQKKTQSKLFES